MAFKNLILTLGCKIKKYKYNIFCSNSPKIRPFNIFKKIDLKYNTDIRPKGFLRINLSLKINLQK